MEIEFIEKNKETGINDEKLYFTKEESPRVGYHKWAHCHAFIHMVLTFYSTRDRKG